MSENTRIEWADDTVNIAGGCTEQRLLSGKMDPACVNCYARLMSVRSEAMAAEAGRSTVYEGVAERTQGHGARWTGVLRWDRELMRQRFAAMRGGRRVFLGSMTDLWHEGHDPALLVALAEEIRAIGERPSHKRPSIITLTKREQRLLAWQREHFPDGLPEWVWPGVTAGCQEAADQRVPVLLQVRAEGPRVVSVEPMTGPVSFTRNGAPWLNMGEHGPGIGWVITGAESGQKARPSHPDWFRAVRDECAAASVPLLHKQNGEYIAIEPEKARRGDVWLVPRPTLTEGVEGMHTQLWQPGDVGAEAGRWSRFKDVVMRRVGKHAAGRLLDGVEHNGRPEIR